jgi:hypothetical protein
MATKILMIIPIVVVVFAGVLALQPSDFRVARTAHMRAPAPAVFAQVNDFHYGKPGTRGVNWIRR